MNTYFNNFITKFKMVSVFVLAVVSVLCLSCVSPSVCFATEKENNPEIDVGHTNRGVPKLAIVIDDFGWDRKGVDDMLSLDCTLTCAVMPALEFSTQDAERAYSLGHEVILHMPMEAYGNLPLSWYGPLFIANNDTNEVARNKLTQAINSTPHIKGVNIHMGTAVSQNERLMTEILSVTKERNLPFLDSRTIENSVCREVADRLDAPIMLRDVFLEEQRANYAITTTRIDDAIRIAKEQGRCIAIGHIGSVGRDITAKCLRDNLDRIKAEGIEIVPLSALYT